MLEIDIKKTIDYCKKYDCQPKPNELAYRLISPILYKKREILDLVKKNNYPFNPKRINLKTSQEKINLAWKLANMLKKYKNIVFLGVTGSVAAGYPKNEDDIDFLVITKKNRLWITRLEIKLFLIKNKISHRKHGEKEKTDQFCFNLWLDESALCLPQKKQNLKNAMDLILMKPIINKKQTYENFILVNGWASKYVANGYDLLIKKFIKKRKVKLNKDKNLVFFMLNLILFIFQYWYMKPKLSKEIVNLKQAFFHPNG